MECKVFTKIPYKDHKKLIIMSRPALWVKKIAISVFSQERQPHKQLAKTESSKHRSRMCSLSSLTQYENRLETLFIIHQYVGVDLRCRSQKINKNK